MKIDLIFAELQTPLFFNGINYGTKLNPLDARRVGLKLIYDRTEKELIIIMGDKATIVPSTNIVSIAPIDSTSLIEQYKDAKEIKRTPTPVPSYEEIVKRGPGRPKAQVSTPTSHVFETK